MPNLPAVLLFLGYEPFPPADSNPARLIHFRQSNGIPRAVLARYIGIDDYTLRCWEEGRPIRKGYIKERIQSLLNKLTDETPKELLVKRMRRGCRETQCLPPTSIIGPLATFGEQLSMRRHGEKISRETLATRIGVSRTKIHAWESDLYLPSHRNMPAVIKFLGMLPLPSQPFAQLSILRRALDFSADSLAKEHGITSPELHRMERGKMPIIPGLLDRLLRLAAEKYSYDKFPRLPICSSYNIFGETADAAEKLGEP